MNLHVFSSPSLLGETSDLPPPSGGWGFGGGVIPPLWGGGQGVGSFPLLGEGVESLSTWGSLPAGQAIITLISAFSSAAKSA